MTQSAGLHEPEDRLSPATIDRHRAYVSVQEELDAAEKAGYKVNPQLKEDVRAAVKK